MKIKDMNAAQRKWFLKQTVSGALASSIHCRHAADWYFRGADLLDDTVYVVRDCSFYGKLNCNERCFK